MSKRKVTMSRPNTFLTEDTETRTWTISIGNHVDVPIHPSQFLNVLFSDDRPWMLLGEAVTNQEVAEMYSVMIGQPLPDIDASFLDVQATVVHPEDELSA